LSSESASETVHRPAPRHRRWRLDELIVDEPSLQILSNEEVVTTEPAQVQTLIALIEAWPEIVDKNRLIDRVWGQRVVSDAAVHKTISLLRRQLNGVGAGDCIETRHRLGYRLTRPPVVLEPASTETPAAQAGSQSSVHGRWVPAILVIVVLIGAAVAVFRPWLVPTEPAVVDAPDAALPASETRITGALASRDFDGLIDLARTSLPADLELAELALNEAEGRLPGDLGSLPRAQLDKYFGILHFYRSEHQLAIERWERALAGFEASGDRNETANVLTNLGAAYEERDAAAATVAEFYDRALALRRELDDPEGLARTLNNLATLWIGRAQVEPARAAVEELRQVADAMASPGWQIRASILAGDIDALLPDADATPAFERAHEQAVLAGRVQDAAVAAQRLARAFGERGGWEQQREWLQRARRHLQSAGLSARLPVVDYAIALNHERLGQPGEARSAYRSVIDQLPDGESIHLRVDAQVGLARLDFQSGATGAARDRLRDALRQARAHGHRLAEVSALLARGFIDLSEPDGLAAAFQAVSEIRARLDNDIPFGVQRHLLRLEALALIGSDRQADALDVLARLRDEARQRGHRAAAQDSQLIESMAYFSAGQFNQGWRAHQLALGQGLVPMPSDQDDALPMARSAATPPQPGLLDDWRRLAFLTLLAFGLGWLLSSLRRSGRKKSDR
jgi:DNA-binding winged helix-turn-helix (wHTH) protein/tetratricopeptide (TPR) repeat protein